MSIVPSSAAWAQSSGRGSTASGLFGSRSLGSGVQSNSQQQTGAGGTGQVGNGAALQQSQQGVGEISGNERFLRENRQGAFVGSDAGDATNVRSQAGAVRAPNYGNLFQNLFNQQGPAFTNQNNGRGSTPLRIPIKLGFEPRPIATAQVSTAFTNRLTNLPAFRSLGPLEVTMQGQIAVLQGVVASEDDRRLAESLAMLEPAVLGVKNELVVGPVPTKAEVLPPASPTPGLP
ncbi:MAG: BON domain-containing protein [Pirellulaceae bacterium]